MYNNNIIKFQESTTILNACAKKVWKIIECTMYMICEHKSTKLNDSKYYNVSLTIQLNISHLLIHS